MCNASHLPKIQFTKYLWPKKHNIMHMIVTSAFDDSQSIILSILKVKSIAVVFPIPFICCIK